MIQPIENKKKVGRPTDFREEYSHQAYQHCMLANATDRQLAQLFNVAESTLYLWKKEYPEFSEAIKRGKETADLATVESFHKRGTGYEFEEEKAFVVDGQIVKTKVTRHQPPDTAAGFIWLKNRHPETWKDKREVHNTSVSANIELSTKELARLLASSLNASQSPELPGPILDGPQIPLKPAISGPTDTISDTVDLTEPQANSAVGADIGVLDDTHSHSDDDTKE